MMRTWLAFATVLHAAVGQAQVVVHVDTVRAERPWPPREVYDFPRVVLADRPAVADRINKYLCVEMLEVDPDTAEGPALFGRVWGDTVSGWMPRLNYLSWQVGRPRASVLQVDMAGEGCGAYCEGFETTFLFDLRDGRHLAFDTLFTAAGAADVRDTLGALWATRLGSYVDSLEQALVSGVPGPEEADHLRGTIALYRTCLEERGEGPPHVHRVSLEAGALRCWIPRCASHVDQALDDLDPLSFLLPFAWCGSRFRPDVHVLFD